MYINAPTVNSIEIWKLLRKFVAKFSAIFSYFFVVFIHQNFFSLSIKWWASFFPDDCSYYGVTTMESQVRRYEAHLKRLKECNRWCHKSKIELNWKHLNYERFCLNYYYKESLTSKSSRMFATYFGRFLAIIHTHTHTLQYRISSLQQIGTQNLVSILYKAQNGLAYLVYMNIYFWAQIIMCSFYLRFFFFWGNKTVLPF